jgi:putative phosphoesterase
MQIGIISDTHGLLRPEALEALKGSDHILHAGDVGNIEILETLKQIAPITAIRGNIDIHGPCAELPATEAVELEGHLFYLIHSLHDLDINPKQAGVSCVVTGHSHKPVFEQQGGVLYLNPGSAGPRRFGLPVTLARLKITAHLTPELITLL